MEIYESIKGEISVPVFRDNAYTGNTVIAFGEDAIIRNSCSIVWKGCEGDSFEIGTCIPAVLSIKLHLPHEDVNTYSLYGARIRLWSAYNGTPWAYRGEYWVTSVKSDVRKKIYTLTASDSLIWLMDNTFSVSGSGKGIPLPDMSYADSMPGYANALIDKVNRTLTENHIVSDSDIIKTRFRHDVCNSMVYEPGHSVAYTGWAFLQDENVLRSVSSATVYYMKQFAQLAAGSVQMIPNPETGTAEMMIVPYGYFPNPEGSEAHKFDDDNLWLMHENASEMWLEMWEPFEVHDSEIEIGTKEIAEYTMHMNYVQFESYDGEFMALANDFSPYRGNIFIDFTRNYFYDGRVHFNNFGFDASNLEPQANVYKQLMQQSIRPFSVKFHKAIDKPEHYPKIGQRITVDGKSSIITKLSWTFRGGWSASCAGGENRMLSQSARHSLAANTRMESAIYTNLQTAGGISGLRDEITAAQDAADDVRVSVQYNNNNWQTIADAFGQLGVDVNLSWRG